MQKEVDHMMHLPMKRCWCDLIRRYVIFPLQRLSRRYWCTCWMRRNLSTCTIPLAFMRQNLASAAKRISRFIRFYRIVVAFQVSPKRLLSKLYGITMKYGVCYVKLNLIRLVVISWRITRWREAIFLNVCCRKSLVRIFKVFWMSAFESLWIWNIFVMGLMKRTPSALQIIMWLAWSLFSQLLIWLRGLWVDLWIWLRRSVTTLSSSKLWYLPVM